MLPFDWQAQGMSALYPAVARPFSDVLGVRAQARSLMTPSASFDFVPAAAIEKVLEAQPTNGLYWLGLAQALNDGGAPFEKVGAALAMSMTVEPMEARTVARRIVFEFSIWDKLSAHERATAINELAKLGRRLPDQERKDLKLLLSVAPATQRAEIQDELTRSGRFDTDFAKWLGI
ncbi:hypothetical protein GGD83_004393 [Rhodoblastus sphagnicola]|uniref:hypothetical protein n=1 Tax=Rhodoblastus sphagnicola TaxID=333368 RepID=UPI0016155D7E|nr:hypothetical protein [Rhodoblastus sphagnicola]MBB4200564.1 hypothetical protein [Rhodoblastus sphagnicola]